MCYLFKNCYYLCIVKLKRDSNPKIKLIKVIMYTRKWRPSASQRREFAQNMQDPQFAAAYYERKEARAAKRRATSKYDYNSAGGMYTPTQAQRDFCMSHMDMFDTPEKRDAANMVLFGFDCQEKVHHDYIHIVNEEIRHYSLINR